jgi:hypothetical protein
MDNIQRFLSNIAPWESAYTDIGLSYFAIRKDNVQNLLQGRLFFNTVLTTIPHKQFKTNDILAGYFPISELKVGYRDLITQLATHGRIKTPIGELVFPTEDNGRVATEFNPFHREGIRNGNRLTVLTLSGARGPLFVKQPDLDWELKAGPEPFDSLNELLLEYSLGTYRQDFTNIEVVAFQVGAVDLNSRVEGEDAEPSVFLAKSLDTNKCQIGFRIIAPGQKFIRGSISGRDLTWLEQPQFLVGKGKVKIPRGAVLQCIVSYAGFAQHQGWIADPKNFQNPRRTALEEFDLNLEVLRDYLFEEQNRRKESRHFEFGVAWLMWLLGFSVAQAGGTPRTSDSADIIATTPKGNMLIVECTTGLLKTENKLSKLIERTEAVRKRLESSGHSYLRLLPVIVTALSREEVRADLDQAKNLGVVVVTKETLTEAVTRTIIASDPEKFFEEALESIQLPQGKIGLSSDTN